jgi:hypothetical protein
MVSFAAETPPLPEREMRVPLRVDSNLKGSSSFVQVGSQPTAEEMRLISSFRGDKISENSDFKFVSRFAKEDIPAGIAKIAEESEG